MKVFQLISLLVGSILALLIWFGSVIIVQSGEVGVVYHFGKVSQETLSPGLNFAIPFITSVKSLDVKTQADEELFVTLSKDGQEIKVAATATYNNNPLVAADTAIHIGLENSLIKKIALQPKLLSTVKTVIAEYTMNDIISNQAGISEEIEQRIIKELESQPNIILTAINVTGISLDPQVQQSIENKVIASQKKEQAKIDNETAQITAQTNKVLADSLSPILVQQQAIEKWSGQSSVFSLGDNKQPVIVQSK
ncbi:prohibitin family protein [Calothrix sp. FACHB-1219]|uniref:prohibitin family protein n=1 Tax=unclassified Calothrix TaxID=2619626 RepID=UPI0016865044|nr:MULTISPECIES: prohibitin family protein [unclassified Calothrix]MBD2201581.1 prohibitin family protein [Calothrix sp. FACHB-168]MBD2217267.1 prohibitin family protein [Calothrix sp. FACHB-1219]